MCRIPVAMVGLVLGMALGILSVPTTCRADASADSLYWIRLERGDSIEAHGAEMAWSDFVRYRRSDGSIGYVPANRISNIFDAAGSDRRDTVLRSGRRLGGPIEASGSEASGSKYHSFRFRGSDRSGCGSFLLTEVGVFIPLKADAGLESEQNLLGSFDLGWMKNVGEHSAVGASGFWESGSDHNRGGVRFRYRRWLDRRLSVELSPGIVVQGNDNYDAPGFIGQAAFNAGDLMSVVLEGEVDRYVSTPYSWNGATYVAGPTQHTTDTTFRVGLRGGSYVGLGASLLAGIAIAALAASFGGGYW